MPTCPLRFALGLALALLLLPACDSEDERQTDFLGLLEDRETFALLIDGLEETGLAATLETGGPYTLFAPTDQAFRALGMGTLATLQEPEQRDILARVLRAHIVPRVLPLEAFTDGERLTTLGGTELEVRVQRGRVTVGGVVVDRSFEADNGVLYGVETTFRDHLTIAERLAISSDLETIRRAFAESGDLDALGGAGPFTVFLPLDDAFDALGRDATRRLFDNQNLVDRVAPNHIVEGRLTSADITNGQTVESEAGSELEFSVEANRIEVDGVRLILPDIPTANGVIHLVANVLTSDLNLNEAALLAGLDLWLDAAARAGLASVLTSDGPYTVFAPLNRAFTDVGGVSHLEYLQREGVIGRVARFHVAPGLFPSSELEMRTEVPTLDEDAMRIVPVTGQIRVGLNVFGGLVTTDIPASNGVIHVVDRLLNPSLSLLETLVFEERRRFVQSLRLTGQDEAFDDDLGGPYTVFAWTDQAFNANPQLPGLLFPNTADELERYVDFHTVEGRFSFTDLGTMGTLPTLLPGDSLTYVNSPNGVFIQDIYTSPPDTLLVRAVQSVQRPTNGVLWRLESVLEPPGQR